LTPPYTTYTPGVVNVNAGYTSIEASFEGRRSGDTGAEDVHNMKENDMTEIDGMNGVDTDNERGHWMTVGDGVRYSRFYPLDPRPEEINLGIIAHHLSQLCRFTGATSRFYSIAEHSVLVSSKMWEESGDPYMGAIGLLHDATEAIVNDINRPLKTTEEMAIYKQIEQRIWTDCIAPRFGLPKEMPALLHEVDIRMCATEKRDLMPGSEEWVNMPEPYEDISLVQWVSPETGKRAFLAQFHQIMEALDA